MQNGRVLKSGYEEGYFYQRHGGGARRARKNCRSEGSRRRTELEMAAMGRIHRTP
jgi:hypothetical protein